MRVVYGKQTTNMKRARMKNKTNLHIITKNNLKYNKYKHKHIYYSLLIVDFGVLDSSGSCSGMII